MSITPQELYADALNSFNARYHLTRPIVTHADARNGTHRFHDESAIAQRILGYHKDTIGHVAWGIVTNDLFHPSAYLDNPQRAGTAGRKRHQDELAAYRAKQRGTSALTEHVSQRGLALIKFYEGYRGDVYDDGTGTPTIGYGHTHDPSPYSMGHLTEPNAAGWLVKDLDRFYLPTVLREINPAHRTQGTIDGLASFVFNLGVGAITDSSNIAGLINAGKYEEAKANMLQYVNPFPAGLRPRREDEAKLINKP